MKKIIHLLLVTVFTVIACNASAQDDILKVAPKTNKLLLDNSHVRVIEGSLMPGEKTAMHHHPGHMIYFLSGGRVRFTLKDGSKKEVTSKTGETRWNEAVDHEAENIGATTVRYLIVEPKEDKM
jgi:quercetin dioxygenase-like cupin family protein